MLSATLPKLEQLKAEKIFDFSLPAKSTSTSSPAVNSNNLLALAQTSVIKPLRAKVCWIIILLYLKNKAQPTYAFDVNHCDSTGKRLLDYAIQIKDLAAMEAILRDSDHNLAYAKGIAFDLITAHKWFLIPPFIAASILSWSDLDESGMTLQARHDLFIQNEQKAFEAAKNEQWEAVIELLNDKLIYPDAVQEGKGLLFYALGNCEALKNLVACGVTLPPNLVEVTFQLAERNEWAGPLSFVELGWIPHNIKWNGRTLLDWACHHQQQVAVETLLPMDDSIIIVPSEDDCLLWEPLESYLEEVEEEEGIKRPTAPIPCESNPYVFDVTALTTKIAALSLELDEKEETDFFAQSGMGAPITVAFEQPREENNLPNQIATQETVLGFLHRFN